MEAARAVPAARRPCWTRLGVDDIAHYYRSRLPVLGEGLDGKDDIHFHPAEKRSLRAAVAVEF